MHRLSVLVSRVTLLVIGMMLAIQGVSHAQAYRGKDFWICFPQNSRTENNHFIHQSIYVAAEGRTRGEIEDMSNGKTRALGVEAGASTFIELDTFSQILGSGKIGKKCYHITTDNDISLYVVSHRESSTESYAAIPTPLLGSEYMVVGYYGADYNKFNTQCDLIATEDNTIVTIHLSNAAEDSLPAGRQISIPLNRGETIQLQGQKVLGKGDLTGSTVSSNHPIAFFTGHQCAQVPRDANYCNMLIEMEPPASSFGHDFILAKWAGKRKYVARVMGYNDSTNVTLDGKLIATIDRGGLVELDSLRNDAVIHTSKPAIVSQYTTSAENESPKIGDPSMIFVTPSDRFSNECTSISVMEGHWKHYLNIVVSDSGLSSLMIDGLGRVVQTPSNQATPGDLNSLQIVIPSMDGQSLGDMGDEYGIRYTPLRRIPNSHLVAITLEVAPGRHLVRCGNPFALYSYGYGLESGSSAFDAYAHNCGERLEK